MISIGAARSVNAGVRTPKEGETRRTADAAYPNLPWLTVVATMPLLVLPLRRLLQLPAVAASVTVIVVVVVDVIAVAAADTPARCSWASPTLAASRYNSWCRCHRWYTPTSAHSPSKGAVAFAWRRRCPGTSGSLMCNLFSRIFRAVGEIVKVIKSDLGLLMIVAVWFVWQKKEKIREKGKVRQKSVILVSKLWENS